MTWLVLTVLVILWAIGYTTDLSGPAIHLLLIVAALVFVIRLVIGRKMA
jgi:hypothetical protein